jgi:hypothetical protein
VVKRCSNIYYLVKKKTCLGVLDIEEIRDKDNVTGLEEGRRNINVNLLVLFHIRDARSLFAFVFIYLEGSTRRRNVSYLTKQLDPIQWIHRTILIHLPDL